MLVKILVNNTNNSNRIKSFKRSIRKKCYN